MFSSTVRLLPAYILVLLLAGTSAVQAQGNENSVPLTLNYHEAEGHVPQGTEVIVWDEQEDAQTLSSWGGRAAMKDSLTDRARESFERVYDRVDGKGQTRTIRIDGGGNTAAYVLARLPDDGEEGHRFYESRREQGAGLDPVQTGNMEMIPVEDVDAAWAKDVFGAIMSEDVVATSLDLTGISADDTVDIRVWEKDGSEFEPLNDRESTVEDDHTSSSATDGTTEDQFERTAYSSKVVYVLARATDIEGEPVLYESTWNDEAGFGPVTDGTITMEPVERDDQATIAAVFPEDSGWGWLRLMVFGLIGGLFLFGCVLVLKAWRSERGQSKGHASKKRVGLIKKFQNAASKLGGTKQEKPHPEKRTSKASSSQELVESGQQSGQGQTVESLRKENRGLRDEIDRLDEKVQKRDATIQELRDQINGAASSRKKSAQSSTTSSPKPRRASTADKVGKAFKKWCTKGSPAMVDRYQLFGRQVESEISSASFRRIMRENNAAGLVFDDNAQDPVEYWLVEARGTAYLLPQPTRNGFRELGECFDGKNVSPSQINTVRPAELKKRGSGFVLEKKGRIE